MVFGKGGIIVLKVTVIKVFDDLIINIAILLPYNKARSRSLATDHPQIHLLSLKQFQQDFSQWKRNIAK